MKKRKVLSLVLCMTMMVGTFGSVGTFAAKENFEIEAMRSSSDIDWEYVDSMDGNSRADEVLAIGIAAAISAELGGYDLARKIGAWLVGAIGSYDWATDNQVVYYTVKQYRGLEYGGTGGYDKYYMKQEITVYKDRSRKVEVDKYEKIMTSFSPMNIMPNLEVVK